MTDSLQIGKAATTWRPKVARNRDHTYADTHSAPGELRGITGPYPSSTFGEHSIIKVPVGIARGVSSTDALRDSRDLRPCGIPGGRWHGRRHEP